MREYKTAVFSLDPLTPNLGRMFPTRPTDYIHVVVSLRGGSFWNRSGMFIFAFAVVYSRPGKVGPE